LGVISNFPKGLCGWLLVYTVGLVPGIAINFYGSSFSMGG